MPVATLEKHTSAWIFQVWTAFVIAFFTMALGIYHLPVDGWTRAFLWLGHVFTVSSSLTLAKTVRDNHEASKLVNRLTDARTERLLTRYEKPESA